eukprot:TRINITY_DN42196_c0_g1_i1.p1 TRINITY_DN42196_c0_g1~~TRINITY_DN42196_c0_g1_i1.p1  ORF type:complete len:572 (+),score=58.83 TRINITY_DN42196_c0_g1_i1:137-1852(+)
MAVRVALKRKTLSAEEPAPRASTDDWESHPRLQRHVQKLLQAGDPASVVARYRRCCETLDKKLLMRHSVHVAAWVALLPEDHPVLSSCADLLAKYLSARSRPQLSPWLRGCLHLVARRMRTLPTTSEPAASHWQTLKSCLPRSVWKLYRASCPALPAAGESTPKEDVLPPRGENAVQCQDGSTLDAMTAGHLQPGGARIDLAATRGQRRAAERFAQERATFDQSYQQAALAQDLLEKSQQAFHDSDAVALCRVLLTASSWLSAPLSRGGPSDAVGWSERWDHCMGHARCAQKLIRQALILCLQGLDLSDRGTRQRSDVQLALQHVSHLLASFGNSDHGGQGTHDWKMILRYITEADGQDTATAVGDDTPKLVTYQVNNSINTGPKAGKWTEEEWLALQAEVEKELAVNRSNRGKLGLTMSSWSKIAKNLNTTRSPSSLRCHYREQTDPAYKRPPKEADTKCRSGYMRKMVFHAFAKLGGQGTIEEVVAICKADAELQRLYGDEMNCTMTKFGSSKRLVTKWQASILGCMCRWASDTGLRKGNNNKRVVWQVKKLPAATALDGRGKTNARRM